MSLNKEIVENVKSKIQCAITIALCNKKLLTFNTKYRSVPNHDGRNTTLKKYHWVNNGYGYTYVLDLLIIGSLTISRDIILDVSRALRLPGKWYSHSIDVGLTGGYYNDCEIQTQLSEMLFNMGRSIREIDIRGKQ